MNGQRVDIKPLGGISEVVPQKPNDASEIVNMTIHRQTMGWDTRVGYEKYDPKPTNLWQPFDTLGRIDSLFLWSRHQGAQDWIFLESGGTLYWLDDVSSGSIMRIQTVESGRVSPALGEAVTSYTPFGRFLIIVNGYDRPTKAAMWPVWIMPGSTQQSLPLYDLGWRQAPMPPTVWGVDNNPATISGNQDVGIWAGSSSDEIGLGSTTASDTNTYRYKQSFVNNSGSEGPLSEASNAVQWETPSSGTYDNSRFITKVEIQKGPEGTVARRLYRTVNTKGGDPTVVENFYFVMEVPNNQDEAVFDHVGDQQLGSLAPGLTDSVLFPAPAARFCATFKNHLFLDGGTSEGTRIYWSKPGRPDEFDALNFMDLGGRDAGAITGLHAHENFLIVMRERGIDMIRSVSDSSGNVWFDAQPVSGSIGTKAKDTITTIPDLGVVFLATDGVYLLSGSRDGGGTISIKKVSDPIMKTIERLNPDVITRATAVYSQKWREWHCYFAADGEEKPSTGIVLHMDRIAWSVREDFPVSMTTTNYEGDIIFGHNEGDGAASNVESGLFVVSRRQACGGEYQVVGQEQSVIDAPPCTSTYRSAWIDFDDPNAKKRVHYVYVYMLSQGDNTATMKYFKDYNFAGTDTPAMKMQRPDHADQKVFDSAVVGTDIWDDELLTQVRFPISQGSCAQFQWEIETQNSAVILGWAIEYTVPGGTKIISGKRA